MTPEAQLRAIDTLLGSKGWKIIKDYLEKEVVSSAMDIATKHTMSMNEIDFRRGSIWMSKQLLNIPENLRLQLQSSLLLQQSTEKGDTHDT